MLENRESVIVKEHRLPSAVRILKRSANLTCLESIFRKASQRLIKKNRIGELRNICQERLGEELEGIRHRPLANAMLVSDLNVASTADDTVSLGTAYARRVLEPVCCRSGEVRRPNFAVGEFDEAPGIIGVSKRGKITVDRSLANSCYSLDLLLRVCEARFDVQKVPSSIDLCEGEP
mgnify:CR=1 FL=1